MRVTLRVLLNPRPLAVRIHRDLLRERRMTGLHFWATGYCVSTVGLDEERIRRYVHEQEKRKRVKENLTSSSVRIVRPERGLPAPVALNGGFAMRSGGFF